MLDRFKASMDKKETEVASTKFANRVEYVQHFSYDNAAVWSNLSNHARVKGATQIDEGLLQVSH